MSNCLVGLPVCQKVVINNKHLWTMCKCMVSMATHIAILNNWDIPTKSIISQLLYILDY